MPCPVAENPKFFDANSAQPAPEGGEGAIVSVSELQFLITSTVRPVRRRQDGSDGAVCGLPGVRCYHVHGTSNAFLCHRFCAHSLLFRLSCAFAAQNYGVNVFGVLSDHVFYLLDPGLPKDNN